jgi:hypothetical protein
LARVAAPKSSKRRKLCVCCSHADVCEWRLRLALRDIVMNLYHRVRLCVRGDSLGLEGYCDEPLSPSAVVCKRRFPWS